VHQGIPTFVGGMAAANQISKAGRKPCMDMKNLNAKNKGPALLGSARDLLSATDVSASAASGLLADKEAGQIVDGSTKLHNFGGRNLSNHLVGLRIGHDQRGGLAVRVEPNIQISIHRRCKLLNLSRSFFNGLPRNLGRFVNRGYRPGLLNRGLGGGSNLLLGAARLCPSGYIGSRPETGCLTPLGARWAQGGYARHNFLQTLVDELNASKLLEQCQDNVGSSVGLRQHSRSSLLKNLSLGEAGRLVSVVSVDNAAVSSAQVLVKSREVVNVGVQTVDQRTVGCALGSDKVNGVINRSLKTGTKLTRYGFRVRGISAKANPGRSIVEEVRIGIGARSVRAKQSKQVSALLRSNWRGSLQVVDGNALGVCRCFTSLESQGSLRCIVKQRVAVELCSGGNVVHLLAELQHFANQEASLRAGKGRVATLKANSLKRWSMVEISDIAPSAVCAAPIASLALRMAIALELIDATSF